LQRKLRAPLAAVLGCAEILQEGIWGALPDDGLAPGAKNMLRGSARDSAASEVEAVSARQQQDATLEATMKTQTLTALLSAIALLSANAALACGAHHRAGNPYSVAHSYQTPRPAKAVAKQEGQTSGPPKVSEANPAPVSPSLAAGLDDTN
jgi:hypothetical protein